MVIQIAFCSGITPLQIAFRTFSLYIFLNLMSFNFLFILEGKNIKYIYIFLNVRCDNPKIYEIQPVKTLFLNIMQLISPFNDENFRKSLFLKFEKINVGK